MNKSALSIAVATGALLTANAVAGTNLVISSFAGNGDLTVTGLWPAAMCRIEWASSMNDLWRRSWQSLDSEDTGTNSTRTYRVPMFFRAVMTSNQPAPGMVVVDAGTHAIGNTYTNEGDADEVPVHDVTLHGFLIDRYEVSKTLWDHVYTWAITNEYTFSNTGNAEGESHPIHSISWYDAVKWCNARSEMEKLVPVYCTDGTLATPYRQGMLDLSNSWVGWNVEGYRLPTEAEWETAARGGLVGHHYPWPSMGGIWSNHINGTKANYWQSGDPYDSTNWWDRPTTPVGYYNGTQFITNALGQRLYGTDMANSLGLYDVAGNVWEWCWDWHDDNWYTNTLAVEDDCRGPASGTWREFRGGSWDLSGPRNCRCSERAGQVPSYQNTMIGFRCARSL